MKTITKILLILTIIFERVIDNKCQDCSTLLDWSDK